MMGKNIKKKETQSGKSSRAKAAEINTLPGPPRSREYVKQKGQPAGNTFRILKVLCTRQTDS